MLHTIQELAIAAQQLRTVAVTVAVDTHIVRATADHCTGVVSWSVDGRAADEGAVNALLADEWRHQHDTDTDDEP
jgi:hypothetical protein